jgi:hypothetical protein
MGAYRQKFKMAYGDGGLLAQTPGGRALGAALQDIPGLPPPDWNGRYTSATANAIKNIYGNRISYENVPPPLREALKLQPGQSIDTKVMDDWKDLGNTMEVLDRRNIEMRRRNIDPEAFKMAREATKSGRVDINKINTWLEQKNDGLTRERLASPGMQMIVNAADKELADIRAAYPKTSWDRFDEAIGSPMAQTKKGFEDMFRYLVFKEKPAEESTPQNIRARYMELLHLKQQFASAGVTSSGNTPEALLTQLRSLRGAQP